MKLGASFSLVSQSLLHFFFPADCLQCRTPLSPKAPLFCPHCASLLELLSPQGRCTLCFQLQESEGELCEECMHHSSPFCALAAACSYSGPAAQLVRTLKYGQQSYLAKGMSALLVAQLEQLQWPLPDAVIPIPQSFMHWLERGFNPSELLAEELGQWIGRPILKPLKRSGGDFSQAALGLEERKKLSPHAFRLKRRIPPLEGKTLLVIDDVYTSGTTLKRAAEILAPLQPQALYGLTFATAFG